MGFQVRIKCEEVPFVFTLKVFPDTFCPLNDASLELKREQDRGLKSRLSFSINIPPNLL